MKKIKVSIKGMHCGSCAGNIEKSIKKISGIKQVTVSAVTNKAFIESEDNVSEKQIKTAIEKVGYKVIDIEKE